MATPITTPFALSGEKDTVPPTDAAGAVNWTSGWTSRYSLNAPAPDRLTVDRKAMNYVDYVMSDAIREIQKQGVASWYIEHAPYAKNAQVFHNGRQWRSSIANNSTEPDTLDSMWVDVSSTNVPPATFSEFGTVKLGGDAAIYSSSLDVMTGAVMNAVIGWDHDNWPIQEHGGSVYPTHRYYRIIVSSSTNITINVQRFDDRIGDSTTFVIMLDKREMTGAAPTLTITAAGAGSIVLKPEGSDPIALSDTPGIAMLYITTMYVDGAQVVTCNLQEWESV